MTVGARLRSRRAPPAATTQVVASEAAIPVAPTGPYVGLVTRAIAFGIDAALINAVALTTTAIVALTFSILSLPHELEVIAAAVGGVAYVLWAVAYFVTFWSAAGQTPGNRLMRIRVVPREGGRLKPRRALVRFAGLTLAAIPLFAGFLLILVDGRRRGLQDYLARTVVVEAPLDPAVDARGRPRAPDRA